MRNARQEAWLDFAYYLFFLQLNKDDFLRIFFYLPKNVTITYSTEANRDVYFYQS